MRFSAITLILFTSLSFIQCKKEEKKLISPAFIDSLATNYVKPIAITVNEEDMQFWKGRINNNTSDLVNKSKYASSLVTRFHLLGDIKDLKSADSILFDLEKIFNGKEAGTYLSLVHNSILQHQFDKAGEYLQNAKTIGIRNSVDYPMSFDVDFENGNIENASLNLDKMKDETDYGYQFRKSKMAHYEGQLDSSIVYMDKAGVLAHENAYLKSVALSNVGDLYVHAGDFEKAQSSYMQSIKINNADLHSIMGLGWIALVHDKNDSLAEKIFKFVETKTKSPDPLYKLILVDQFREDNASEIKHAKEFEAIVTDSLYGKMYNKYIIPLYIGCLNNPAKAEVLAKNELESRATPQTYSWYAYSLLANNKLEEANAIYEKHISGKPLEALELYYMGKLMEANKKGFNAKEFYKAAYENLYDLPPNLARDLESKL